MNKDRKLEIALDQLFCAQKWALFSSASLVAFFVFARTYPVAQYAMVVSLSVLEVAAITAWFYIFRIVRPIHGTGYAIGHVVISILLTPALLIGLVLIPVLVRGDVERLVGLPDVSVSNQ